jgi:uncharacterized membrane protein YheB (UPF0754 family)
LLIAISGDLVAFYTPLSETDEAIVRSMKPLSLSKEKNWSDNTVALEVSAVLAGVTLLYLCGLMPLATWSIITVAVSFTWFHIALALRMCFFPFRFRGLSAGPLRLGWEGIIPRKATKMARKSCDLIVDRLIYVDRILDRIYGSSLSRHLGHLGMFANIENEITIRLRERMFGRLPDSVSNILLRRQDGISEKVCCTFVSALVILLKDRSVFSVSHLIIDEFGQRKDVLVNLFTRVGGKELALIERSGVVMGFLCGAVQIALHRIYSTESEQINSYNLFSVTGFVIGLVKKWIALFVIFNPIEPVVLFSNSKRMRTLIHSLFLRRQEEVSRVYSKIVTESVLNVDQVISHLKSKNKWIDVVNLFESVLKDEIRNRVKSSIPFLPTNQAEKLTDAIHSESMAVLESKSDSMTSVIVPFIEHQIQLETQLYVALVNLSYKEFDGILHPVFQEDESTLIILGGVLGALVGLLQVFFFNL